MLRAYREIWYAIVTIVAVTAIYLFFVYQRAGSLPGASSAVGLGIGILGIILMLMTETLYSIRKQLTDARWGSMAGWLRFHIVTGLVGPYMVLLHTSMMFRGLAGVVMLLTVVVVVSGVVGRYIYTALPRTIDLADPEEAGRSAETQSGAAQPEAAQQRSTQRRIHRLAAERNALSTWRSVHLPLTWALFTAAAIHAGAALYYATMLR
jgi:hypothetical protein